MAPATLSLRSLLRKATSFVWTSECQSKFQRMKEILTVKRYIKPFDPELNIELLVNT